MHLAVASTGHLTVTTHWVIRVALRCIIGKGLRLMPFATSLAGGDPWRRWCEAVQGSGGQVSGWCPHSGSQPTASQSGEHPAHQSC